MNIIDVLVLSQIFVPYLLGIRTEPRALADPCSPATPSAPHEHSAERISHPATSSRWSDSTAKRLFDIAAALTGILLCAPLLLAVACVVRFTSRGPVLFRQRRAGLGDTTFTIYKFRTMVHGAEHHGPSVTRANDCRMTPVGATLRRYKLDELPQLFNVLTGSMSMVGPRPKLREHEPMPLRNKPGITGAATLAFAREEDLLATIPEHDVESYTVDILNPIKADLDMRYARTATLLTDCRILLQTLTSSTPETRQAPTLGISHSSPTKQGE